jgi:hypothetical protein
MHISAQMHVKVRCSACGGKEEAAGRNLCINDFQVHFCAYYLHTFLAFFKLYTVPPVHLRVGPVTS